MNVINAGIYSKLSGGTALTALLGGAYIYHLQAPTGKELPYVVYSWQGGGQTPDHDIVSRLEFVRAYATSAAQAGSIFAQVDALLNGGSVTVAGWSNVTTRREDDYETVETLPNDEPVYTIGGMYRFIIDI